MKTIAKQTGKLNGTSSLMVLAILFLTALPISNVKAGGIEEKSANTELVAESTESVLPIEDWMLEGVDWVKGEMANEDARIGELENWMLTPENWDADWHSDVAEHTDYSQDQLDVWMFEPAVWSSDLAGLTFYF